MNLQSKVIVSDHKSLDIALSKWLQDIGPINIQFMVQSESRRSDSIASDVTLTIVYSV
ncbi:MAG: hypothetical protein JWM59_2948 [Verrucomicrobiales bacterium]|nr:hypothetical protein [Verrucomicrobiales bacterium]